MFAFFAVVCALYALSVAIAPVWLTSKKAMRRHAVLELITGSVGLLGFAAVAAVCFAAVRADADAAYSAWIGETLSFFALILLAAAGGTALLTALAALASPTKWHAVRAAVFPAAAAAVLLLAALFAAAGENDGSVRADTFVRLFGLFAALIPALGVAADRFLLLRTLPEDKKPEKKHRRR